VGESATGIARQFVDEPSADLPEIVRIDWKVAKEVFRDADSVEQAAFFTKGFAASCVVFSFGDGSLEQFANEMQEPYSTVAEHQRIYRRLMRLDQNDRSELLRAVKAGKLRYTHLLLANPLQDDAEYLDVLRQAHDKSWSRRKLGEVVALRRSLNVAEGQSPATVAEDEGFYDGEEPPLPGVNGTGGEESADRWNALIRQAFDVVGGLKANGGASKVSHHWPEDRRYAAAQLCYDLAIEFEEIAAELRGKR
jgi:hypothetical protein